MTLDSKIEKEKISLWRRFQYSRVNCAAATPNSNGVYICKYLTKENKNGCKRKFASDEEDRFEVGGMFLGMRCKCVAYNYKNAT